MKALLIVLNFWAFTVLESKHPPGHLQPLGSHQPPVGSIASTGTVPGAKEFFEQNALPGEPLLFKGAAKKMPAYSKWTDEYLSEKFGEEAIDVEEGKKENRSLATFHFKLQDFISRYKNEDIYMVESLPEKMKEEYALLKSLNCGGYTNVLQDAVVWFSSGGTNSVLHIDAVDNINCLFDGTKELLLINKTYLEQAHIDRLDGGFSSVDVDSVDMYKFPGLQTIPYYKVFMEAGDCLFIPARWVHQVRSYGTRNLAVNIWWAHFIHFNHTDCEQSSHKDKELIPLNLFDFHPNEGIRQASLQALGGKPVTLEQWIELIQREAAAPGQTFPVDILTQNFHEIDKNSDSYVTPEEIYDLNYTDLERLLGGTVEEETEQDVDNIDTTEEGNTQPEDSPNDRTDEEHISHSDNENEEHISDLDNELDRKHTEL